MMVMIIVTVDDLYPSITEVLRCWLTTGDSFRYENLQSIVKKVYPGSIGHTPTTAVQPERLMMTSNCAQEGNFSVAQVLKVCAEF